MSSVPKKNRPSGWPDNSSSTSTSTSLSSSFSSYSAASGMLPQDSSQSDIVSSDHFASSDTPLPAPIPRHAAGHDFVLAASRPRTSSLAVAMGQNYSKPKALSISTAATAATSTGTKLKRLVGRRKKSEDATKLFAGNDKGKEREWDSPASTTSSSQVTTPSSKSPRSAKLTHFANQAFSGGGRKATKPAQISPTPPTPPPKPWNMQPANAKLASLSSSALPSKVQTTLKADNRGSIIPMSPGISSAVNFMRLGEQERDAEQAREKERAAAAAKEAAAKETEQKNDQKDLWRKSDSTMSHHTIRPGAGAGPRSSRPVSMAESLQSNHTVVPANKRLSALITDAEFETPEEEDDSSFKSAYEEVPITQLISPSSSSSLAALKNRRSISLNLGSKSLKVEAPAPLSTSVTLNEPKPAFKTVSEPYARISPSSSNEMSTLTRAAANGFIAPTGSGVQSAGNNIRGRLAALTATHHNQHHPSSHPVPPSAYHRTPSPQPPSQRAAAISITASLAPAANLARRAAEKFGRWGGFSSSSGGSGYSSSSSSTSDHALGRTISNNSSGQMSSSKGKTRRTPEAPSGAWSVSSSGGGSLSDSDAFHVPSGPSLGTPIRGPLRMNARGTAVAGGIVFGRKLSAVVHETAIGVGIPNYFARGNPVNSTPSLQTPGHATQEELKALETRRLPALVVRCAQHLLLWGVGEEGLFRVSGRPTHVSKLRNEFDTGADYNMGECSPGELDPHAVASVFKAFLRELPEPILTNTISPYFEAALAHEHATNDQSHNDQLPQLGMGGRGPTLPSGPKSGLQGLRKPPSLSTLAMPNFSSMRPPSRGLLNAFKSLVGQLPVENRDLIRTVAELIRATAKESQQTKMPLSNLLLVFCPSLNMSPPLLRVLCEATDIWEGDDTVSVLDITREDEVLDISPTALSPVTATAEPALAPAEEPEARGFDETQLTSASTASSSPASLRSVDRHEERKNRSKKPLGPRRAMHSPPVVHLESHNGPPAVGIEYQISGSPDISSESTSLRDDGSSYISTSDTRSESVVSPFERTISSPPPLSSSAESLTSPSSSFAAPSLDHLPLEKLSSDKPNEPDVDAEMVQIVEDDTLTPRRLLDPHVSDGPVQFPTTASDHSPTTSVSLRVSSHTTISLPGSPPPGDTNSAPSSPRARRLKRPSLQLLFSKRSASTPTEGKPYISSPMASPYLITSSPSSDSSVSTPASVVTAHSSTFTLPPILDTAIQSSPLRFGLGFDVQRSPDPELVPPQTSQGGEEEEEDEEPVSVVVGETPIANRYCTPSSSTLSLLITDDEPSTMPSHRRLHPTSRTKQIKTSVSSNHLGVPLGDQEDQEDWTQSVLLAADSEGNWSLS